MIINLIKANRMFSLALPKKIKGQYWMTDVDESGRTRQLIGIEAIDGEWVLKSNKNAAILAADERSLKRVVLKPMSFFNLRIAGSRERVILFCERMDAHSQNFAKLVVRKPDTFRIGRTNDNHFCFDNRFVSGQHARLSYDGSGWTIVDKNSANGTYVNGLRVTEQHLQAGDLIYIMGLRIIIGGNFLAVNNPDGLLYISSNSLVEYVPQEVDRELEPVELPDKQFYYRSPRFHREIEQAQITIDPPPQSSRIDSVPMALMLGPSVTMGMTSMSTGLLSAWNIMSAGGDISQAVPTLMMSGGMLLGTVLWPILTKNYEKRTRLEGEKRRQEKYLAYLDQVRDEIRRISKEQSDILKENMVSPMTCAERIVNQDTSLWERSIGQTDFMQLRVGCGDIPLEAEVKYTQKRFAMEDDALQDAMLALGTEPKRLTDVPIGVSLVDNWVVGLIGARQDTHQMLRAMVLQMVALHSYDELKIMLITEANSAAQWDFVRSIPHFWNADKTARFFASSADEVKELSACIDRVFQSRIEQNKTGMEHTPYYVVLTTDKKLADKCEGLKKVLSAQKNCGFSAICVAEELKDLPKETNLVVHADGERSFLFDKDDTTGRKQPFKADRLDGIGMGAVALRLANCELDLTSQNYAIPSVLTFLEMFNVSKIEHLNSLTRWRENNPTISLQTPVGVDAYGSDFMLDLHEKFHGPHGLVAGMTGSGKSEFIITYILSMAVNYHPNEVAFILIDYKGGGLAGAFEDPDRGIRLPHLAGTITNLDGSAVKRSLVSIQSELRRRQGIFNDARKLANEGTMDIYKYQQLYRDKVVTEPLPHLFIISDEFAELKQQQPEFMDQLISTARIGRSLGVHLILATQKPNGVVNEQIWSNSKFRVCLKVQEQADSQDMIKCPDAAALTQTGRFYLQVGYNELFALGQSAWCGAEYIPTETVEKTVDSSIQVVDNLGRMLMSVKPGKKECRRDGKVKQIVAIVKYLSELAKEEHISARPLWLDPIPDRIYTDALEREYSYRSTPFVLEGVVGEYDDPFNQDKGLLTVPLSRDGNCLIYGSTGNGKTTFLTTLCHSLLKHHSAEEMDLYILDFASGTLKIFEKAPQVGGVVLSSDEEKLSNFFKMLMQEIERRKKLFADYGGDYTGYLRSGSSVPNIVVMLNNISGFTEQYEDLVETFNVISRDGVKYGIYFVVTAGSSNAVRYRTLQNFKTVMTMQLNDASEYSVVVGKTDGLVPAKFKGRGLVKMDDVYEFQTAYCTEEEDQQAFLRRFCSELADSARHFAKKIPILPDVVDIDHVRDSILGFDSVPMGVSKKDLDIRCVDLSSRIVFPVVGQDLKEMQPFVRELYKVLRKTGRCIVFDAEQIWSAEDRPETDYSCEDVESVFGSVFMDMVTRNNAYKDAGLDKTVLDDVREYTCLVVGAQKLYERMSSDGRGKLVALMQNAQSFYKIHFVLVDTKMRFDVLNMNADIRRQTTGVDGLWIGDGVSDQYQINVTGSTLGYQEEIGSSFGWLVTRGRPTLIKLLSDMKEGN